MLKSREEIRVWLNEMGINNYIINDDLTVDVNGYVDISNKGLKEIPVQFGIVDGVFYCSNNKLTSLKGSPKESWRFYCDRNELTSLQGAPKECERFYCSDNQLTSLEGAPKMSKIVSDFSKEEIEAYKNGGKIKESTMDDKDRKKFWNEFYKNSTRFGKKNKKYAS